jgi:holdfast attachment protein HfaA
MGRTMQAGGLAVLLALAAASAASAQSASSSASQYSRGYGFNSGEVANPVNVSTRDANGNRVITDGVIQTGNDNSMFGKLSVSGAYDQFSGAGSTSSSTGTAAGSATAIGNNLVVVTSGSYNTVIVNATQTNNGPVTATTTVLNGKVNLDGGQ